MKTFLSVDLDYWNEVDNGISRMVKYLKSIHASNIPVVLVKDHDEMLPFVDQSEANFLINLDYHSDLADLCIKDEKPVLENREFNCGTWINWVKCRNKGRFLWIHPHKDCYIRSHCKWDSRGGGRCDVDKNPFTTEFDTGWKEAKHRTGPPPKVSGISGLVMIGLCISPDYISFDQEIPYEALTEAGFDRSDRCIDGPVIYQADRKKSWVKCPH